MGIPDEYEFLQNSLVAGPDTNLCVYQFWRPAITRTTRKPDMRRHCFDRLDASLLIVYKTCNQVGAFTDLTGANFENRQAPSRVAKAICCSHSDHRCAFRTANDSPHQ